MKGYKLDFNNTTKKQRKIDIKNVQLKSFNLGYSWFYDKCKASSFDEYDAVYMFFKKEGGIAWCTSKDLFEKGEEELISVSSFLSLL